MEKWFISLSSITSKVLGFIHWVVFDLFFRCVTVKTIYWLGSGKDHIHWLVGGIKTTFIDQWMLISTLTDCLVIKITFIIYQVGDNDYLYWAVGGKDYWCWPVVVKITFINRSVMITSIDRFMVKVTGADPWRWRLVLLIC